MEPLIEIPRSEWSSLKDLFENNWPRTATAICLLDSFISYPDFIGLFDFKVYCPFGNISNGMITISDQFGHYKITIHPIDSIKEIKTALSSTKLIDWNRQIVVPAACSEVENCLKGISKDVGVDVDAKGATFVHIAANSFKRYENLSCPTQTFVAPLRAEHIRIVDESWTFRDDTSHKLFETLLKYDLTYVLYSDKNKEPIAWTSIGVDGSLTHLYCLEPYKKQGYGEFITKFATNDQSLKGKKILAYTLEGNKIAQNMFHKVGFEKVAYVKWIYISKNK